MSKNNITLKTGKEIYCYNGILGTNGDGEIYYGYDGVLTDRSKLTKDEKIEVADIAIKLWETYKNNLLEY